MSKDQSGRRSAAFLPLAGLALWLAMSAGAQTLRPARWVTVTWTNPVDQVAVFAMTAPGPKGVVTNLVRMTNWVDVQARTPAGIWRTVARTNRPPVRVRAVGDEQWVRLKSFWQ